MKCKLIPYLVSILFFLSSGHELLAQPSVRELEGKVVDAQRLLEEGNHEEAAVILLGILETDDTIDAAWYYLTRCAIEEDDPELAEICISKALEIDPDNYWYREMLGYIYAGTSRTDKAIEVYEKILEENPKETEVYTYLLQLYIQVENYERALELIDDIENEYGAMETLAVYKYRLLNTLNRGDEAYQSLVEYNEKYSSPYVLTILAELELAEYNDTLALKYYDEALSVDSEYVPAIIGKAEAYRFLRKYDDYIDVLNYILDATNVSSTEKADYFAALANEGDDKFLTSYRPQLDTIYNRMVEIYPQDTTCIKSSAIYYIKTDRQDKSGELLRKNIEIDPTNPSHVKYYIYALLLFNDMDTLSSISEEGYYTFPQEKFFLEMAIYSNYNLKNYEKVLELSDVMIENTQEGEPYHESAMNSRAEAYYAMGQKSKAYKAYEELLKIYPDNIAALNNYAYYLSLDGKKLGKACKMSLKAVTAEGDNPSYLDTYGWILYLRGELDEAKLAFKKAMIFGGKEEPVMLDHYAEVLYALEEYEMAFAYWEMALLKNEGEIEGLEEKIKSRRTSIKK